MIKSSPAKEILHQIFPSIHSPILSMCGFAGDSGEEKLPFNRNRPQVEPNSGRAAIYLDQLEGERTGQRHKHSNIGTGTPAMGKRKEKKKHICNVQ